MESLGDKNILYEVEGTTLTLKVDLSKTYRPSKSGKSTLIASTSGNIKVLKSPYESVVISVNIYN